MLALVNQYEADLLEKALARCRRVLDFVDAHVLAPLEPSEQQRILDRRWVMTAGWHRPAPAAFAALAVVVRDADCADVALTFCGPTFLEAIRAYILRKAPLSHLMRREAPHATLRKTALIACVYRGRRLKPPNPPDAPKRNRLRRRAAPTPPRTTKPTPSILTRRPKAIF